MSLEQQWRAMVGDLMIKKSDFVKLESDLETKVIHFLDERKKNLVLPKALFMDYWNVLEFFPEVFSDEFSGEPSSAVFFRDCDFQKPLGFCRKLYFSPSVGLGEKKKDIFLAHPNIQVHFGVDPYSLGLWQSKIFKNSLSSDFLSFNGSKGTVFKEKIGSQLEISESGVKVFRLSSLAFDLAGASSIQQLAVVLAAFVQLVEDFRGEWSVEELFKISSFEISLNPRFFWVWRK